MMRLFGLKGSMKAGLYLSWQHEIFPSAVIRCSHIMVNELLATLFFITNFNGTAISLSEI